MIYIQKNLGTGRGSKIKDLRMKKSESICKNCKFWDAYEPKKSKYGLCRRFPPMLTWPDPDTDDEIKTNIPPTTYDVDWCGEFKNCKERCQI